MEIYPRAEVVQIFERRLCARAQDAFNGPFPDVLDRNEAEADAVMLLDREAGF